MLAIEYDPIRSARLALLEYSDGERRYIIAPNGLEVGRKVVSGSAAPPEIGNALFLKNVPIGMAIHNLEMIPGKGGQMVRSAGGSATLMSRDEGYAQVRLPSGEIRKMHEQCPRPSDRWATSNMKTSSWARPDAAAIAGDVPSAGAWPRTRWIIRWAAERAKPPAAAIP